MRSLIIGFVVFLVACNQGTTVPAVPYDDTALVAKVDAAEKRAEAAEASANKANDALKQIQLWAGVRNQTDLAFRAVLNAVDFGPCDNAGIKVGATIKLGGSALDEQTQAFKQTPTQTCPGVYAEYDVFTGNLHTADRVYFESSDCTGTPLVWDAGGRGYDDQKLPAGIAFINPMDNGQYWVPPGSNGDLILANSVYIVDNGACTSDGDQEIMWAASPADVTVSGVPLTLGPGYQLSGL